MGSVLGLDYGRQRIGVAVSDPLGLTAQPVETWSGLRWEEVVQRICKLVEQKDVERVVVGFPLTLKGKKGFFAREVEQFVERLRHSISIPVTLWDERMTSIQARRLLHQMGEKPSRRKEKVDLISSVLLLQNYLDYTRMISGVNQGVKD